MTDQKEPEVFHHTLTIEELPPCTHSITNVGVTGYTNDPTISPHDPPMLAENEKLKEVLRGYEQWEADLIMSHEAWGGGYAFPTITVDLWHQLMALQAQRNSVLSAGKSEG